MGEGGSVWVRKGGGGGRKGKEGKERDRDETSPCILYWKAWLGSEGGRT